MHRTIYAMLVTLVAITGASAQKYKSKTVEFSYHQFAKEKLDTSVYHTYSVGGSLPDYMGGSYALATQNFTIGGLRRSAGAGGDMETLLNFAHYQEDNHARPALQAGSKKVNINGRDTTVPAYSYQGSFFLPYSYTLRDNVKGEDMMVVSNQRPISVATAWYTNSEEAVRNWEGTVRGLMAKKGGELLREITGLVQSLWSMSFYSGRMKWRAEVYYMKDTDKYPDLDSAAGLALAAYPLITAEQHGQHDSFANAVAPAEAIWLRALAEHGVVDANPRINDKVANIILFNLAWASYWKNDISVALRYAERARENNKRDGWVAGFLRVAKEQQGRLTENGIPFK